MENLEGVPTMQIITICLDAEEVQPKIDLGNIHPFVAYSVFAKALEMLDEIMAEPEITYQGEVISPYYYEVTTDDEDED